MATIRFEFNGNVAKSTSLADAPVGGFTREFVFADADENSATSHSEATASF